MLHAADEFQEALQCFTRVVQNYDKDKEIFIQRGRVYQDMGNHQFAIEDFNRAIDEFKNHDQGLNAFYYRGISRLKSKDLDRAEKDFEKAQEYETEDQNPGIYDGLGQVQYARGKDYEAALSFFDQSISISPENIQFLMNRAQCFYTMASYDQAIEDLNQALDVEGEQDNPQLYYKLGLVYYAYEKYRRCIKTMKKSIKAKPYLTYESDVYYHVGLSFCRLERFEESIFPYTKAVELVPSDIRYVHERAKAFQMIHEHDNAIDDFSKVIKRNPKNAHAYFRRAFSFKALK